MSDEWELQHDHETSPSLEQWGLDDDIDIDDPTSERSPTELIEPIDDEPAFDAFDLDELHGDA